VDSIKEWMAFIGRRNIAYVVFVSLLVPFGMLMEAAGPTRSGLRRRDHGRDIPVERGVADILHRQCGVGDRLYSQRPVGNEAL
jgi:hypothetical protein